MTIAIDGTCGSGKSTIASRISELTGFVNLNSGNLYRAISHEILRCGINLNDECACSRFASGLELAYAGASGVSVGGDVLSDDALHSREIDSATSVIASYVEIRGKVNSVLRRFAQNNDVVCEGRDICTVVFPNADLKFYVDASLQVRAMRRSAQQGGDLEETRKELARRDESDKNRRFGALVRCGDSEFIDTTSLTVEQAVEIIRQRMRR